MCPEIPLWFIALAVFGAMSLAVIVLCLVANLLAYFLFRPKRATHINQITRRIFGE